MQDEEKALITQTIGDGSNADFLLSEIEKDIKKQNENHLYSDTLIRIIVMSSQEFEILLRDCITKNGIKYYGDIWRSSSGQLLSHIEKSGKFNSKQIESLRQIIKYRNWVIHEVYQEEQEYDRTHQVGNSMIDRREWKRYYQKNLAITKSVIFEAIDLFTGVTSLLSTITDK